MASTGNRDEDEVILNDRQNLWNLTRRLMVWRLIAVLVVMAGASDARAQVASGVIAGTIADPQGGALPGVTLTVRSVETGVIRTSVSQGDGVYRVGALPPGHYDLTVELQGFATTVVKDITLTVGEEFRRDVALQIGGVQEAVTVKGREQLIEPTKVEVSMVVTQQQLTSLPIQDRSAVSLALLTPGTNTDGTRARRPGASVGIGDASLAGTNYLIDGMNNNTLRSGDAREDVPESEVQEFRVITSQAPAEFGGRVGGVINVVSKSGGNTFSGEGFEFFRDKALNRVDEFQQAQHDQLGTPINDFRRDQFGAAAGGPLIKDRLHIFASYERKKDQEFFTVNTGKPQDYASLEGTFPGGSLNESRFARGDLQINPAQRLFFRYSRQESTYYADGAGGTNAAFSAGDASVPGFSYIAGHTWVLSPRVLNEFTAMYAESFEDKTQNTDMTPAAYATAGSARYVFPRLTGGICPGTHFRNVYRQFRDAVSLTAGNHDWTFGGGAQYIPTYMVNPGNPNGTWTFGTDQVFNPASPTFSFLSLKNPTQFSAALPTFYPVNNSHTYEAYVQDAWRPRPSVTVELGARYDLQTKIFNEDYSQSQYPRPLPYVDFASRGDKNNIAPRVGVAWDVHDDGRSVVRAGYGIIYFNIQNGTGDGETNAFQQHTASPSRIRAIRIRIRARARCRLSPLRRRTSPSTRTTSSIRPRRPRTSDSRRRSAPAPPCTSTVSTRGSITCRPRSRSTSRIRSPASSRCPPGDALVRFSRSARTGTWRCCRASRSVCSMRSTSSRTRWPNRISGRV